MQLNSLFFKAAALCAIYYAIIQTIQFWLSLRLSMLENNDKSVSIDNHPYNVLRMWLVLSSMFLLVIAFGGVALAKLPAAPELAALGFVFSLIFVFIEICYRSIELFAVNNVLIPQHLNETDLTSKAAKGAVIEAFNASIKAVYFPLLVSIMLTSVLFGLATINGRGFEGFVSLGFFVRAIHILMRILEIHGGMKRLSAFNFRMYFPLAISSFILIGAWLWSQ